MQQVAGCDAAVVTVCSDDTKAYPSSALMNDAAARRGYPCPRIEFPGSSSVARSCDFLP